MVKIGEIEFQARANPRDFVEKRRSECASEGHKRERIIEVNIAQTNCYCLHCFSNYSKSKISEDHKRFYGYASQKVLETSVSL